jgi:hypothetical protein
VLLDGMTVLNTVAKWRKVIKWNANYLHHEIVDEMLAILGKNEYP